MRYHQPTSSSLAAKRFSAASITLKKRNFSCQYPTKMNMSARESKVVR
jgi:hypothetical protein